MEEIVFEIFVFQRGIRSAVADIIPRSELAHSSVKHLVYQYTKPECVVVGWSHRISFLSDLAYDVPPSPGTVAPVEGLILHE